MAAIEKGTIDDILAAKKPVLVDFYAEWCGPCLAMMPTLEQFAEEVQEDLKVYKINVDQNLDLVKEYKIMGVPTFILFKAGEIVWKQAGVLSKEQLREVVKQHVA